MPAIAKVLEDPVPGLREAAANALGEIGGPQAVRALVRTLKVSEQRNLLQIAVLALAKIGDRSALADVLDAIHEKYHVWRANGMFFVMAKGFAESVATPDDLPLFRKSLLRLMEIAPESVDKWWGMPAWMRTLAKFGDERDVPELLDGLKKWPVLTEIVEGLGRIGYPGAAEALAEHFRSHPSDTVAEALAKCGEPGIEAVRAALESDDPEVRRAACQGI